VLHLCKHIVRQDVGTHVIIHVVKYSALLKKSIWAPVNQLISG